MNGMLRIGVDVGGTNTDAALLRGSQVLATVKTGTTGEVTGGVAAAIRSVPTSKPFRRRQSPAMAVSRASS